MHLLDPLGKDYKKLADIFENIFNKNTIAFLGAGASVSNNQYLSSELIKLYETKISKNFGTHDIIKFVDILQSTPGLSRGDFDAFVIEQLRKLKPNVGHEIFVTIPWKQVITTNYDTLVEEASEEALRSNKTHFNLHPVRNRTQLDFQRAESEITYIKLNGCKTDLSLFPLVFSTNDFEKQKPYYKKVLSPFRMYSNEISYLAFGYSFTDIFAEILLEKVASSDIRQKRVLYCVDPFVNNDRLSYLESKKISVIKLSFIEFFQSYQKWFENTNKNYLKSLQKFTNPDNTSIKVAVNARLYLDSNILQLKDEYRTSHKLRKADFYYGEEPTYQVVVDDYDVIKNSELKSLIEVINDSFAEHTKTAIPKLILIKGDFGSGKTTFTLRAIREYLKTSTTTLAFEITNPLSTKKGYLSSLIKESSATQFLFYCDNIETDSIYKSFNDLRADLASEQYSGISIIFVSSIRLNILEKFKNNNKIEIKNSYEFEYNACYSRSEVIQLVENLKEVGILDYRDLSERDSIVFDISRNYKGDSFITLYKLIENGVHYKFLEKAYEELSDDVKNAFKITALIHRFNMLCPVSVVKNSLKGFDWEEFTEKVVKGDGKGILFHDYNKTIDDEPDLYFKTKHPVIADALIKTIINNNEKNSLYKNVFTNLTLSDYNSRFIVDLIKGIRNNDTDISEGQIENYYELAKKEFEKSPHFMLSYITNIEKRTNSIETLEKCLTEIRLIEGELERRNHRLVHRKGSVCFKIARLLYKEKDDLKIIKSYLEDAEEWFDVKKHLDPSSPYSYLDYFNLLLWKLRDITLTKEELTLTHLTINNLFDEAYRLLYSNIGKIDDLRDEYYSISRVKETDNDYIEFLLEIYQDVNRRPIACILLFFYYNILGDMSKCGQFQAEMESYLDNKDVVYFLFKQYGRNLHVPNNRIKYFDLVRQNSFLQEEYPLRYYYFTGICEFYNWKWRDGKDLLAELKFGKYYILNPDFFLYWKNSDGEIELFDAIIIVEKKLKKVKIVSPLFKEFMLIKGKYDSFKEGGKIKVKLKFFLEGIRAEIHIEKDNV